MDETELKCYRCGFENRIPLYQPSWLNVDLSGKEPSGSMYRNDYKLADLLKINVLLGEQNEVLKRQVNSLMESLKYYIKESKKDK